MSSDFLLAMRVYRNAVHVYTGTPYDTLIWTGSGSSEFEANRGKNQGEVFV